MSHANLFTRANPKTRKGEALGYDTLVLHLAPADVSGFDVCPQASAGCRAACLNTAGRGAFARTQIARIRRTRALFSDRRGFLRRLSHEITLAERRARKHGRKLAVRLNGTSDLPWERMTFYPRNEGQSLMDAHPSVTFYDYTKSRDRMDAFMAHALPPNYHLTFSRSECNDSDARDVLSRGGNVAIVASISDARLWALDTRAFPKPTMFALVDGDAHDLRFLNPPASLVCLSPKGRARRDVSGFVVRFSH